MNDFTAGIVCTISVSDSMRAMISGEGVGVERLLLEQTFMISYFSSHRIILMTIDAIFRHIVETICTCYVRKAHTICFMRISAIKSFYIVRNSPRPHLKIDKEKAVSDQNALNFILEFSPCD